MSYVTDPFDFDYIIQKKLFNQEAQAFIRTFFANVVLNKAMEAQDMVSVDKPSKAILSRAAVYWSVTAVAYLSTMAPISEGMRLNHASRDALSRLIHDVPRARVRVRATSYVQTIVTAATNNNIDTIGHVVSGMDDETTFDVLWILASTVLAVSNVTPQVNPRTAVDRAANLRLSTIQALALLRESKWCAGCTPYAYNVMMALDDKAPTVPLDDLP